MGKCQKLGASGDSGWYGSLSENHIFAIFSMKNASIPKLLFLWNKCQPWSYWTTIEQISATLTKTAMLSFVKVVKTLIFTPKSKNSCHGPSFCPRAKVSMVCSTSGWLLLIFIPNSESDQKILFHHLSILWDLLT